jgi:hypothetical protein
MYCPQCATEVTTGLHYCRSCGLSLAAVEAALDSRLSLAGSHLQRGTNAIKFGLVWMGLFVVIAGIAALSSGAFDVTIGLC